jgi:diguanylate cyclase (GGDEF)-like protein
MVRNIDERSESNPNSAEEPGQQGREFARVSRALTTLSAGNRTLLRASDEQALMYEMCRVIVETGGYRMAGVGYAEHDAQKTLRWMAAVGIELSFLGSLRSTWSDEARGRVAKAIRTGAPSGTTNILTDGAYAGPIGAKVREYAIQKGIASTAAFPLRVEGEVIGGLIMGAAESDAFDAEEVKLLGDLADDLAYGISHLRKRVQHREAEATIARLAYFDELTGLANRTLLLKRVDDAMQAATRQARAMALLHLQVDHFHDINQVLGYQSGDALVRELSRRLKQAIRGNETLARVGEAEFAVLLPAGEAEYAIQVAKGFVRTLQDPVEFSGLMLDARVGVGIALFPGHATKADSLIRCANSAMHAASRSHAGFAMYSCAHEARNTRRLTMMSDLRRAIEHNELRLYCQPKVDIASRKPCGAEALVRWQHPEHGIISPNEFIGIAEQAGLITSLTKWMLEAVFRQSHDWQKAGRGRALAVNLSAHDLIDPRLVEHIRGLFSTWALAPELIQFELTESALMTDPAGALATLASLKRLNVQLFIDDFGTGYSSLSYLHRLPVDAIKIDKSFVTSIVSSNDSALIVRSTIELGHKLGLKIVAEGIETEDVWASLAAMECDVAQGYFIGTPMPAGDFDMWEQAYLSGLP